ncbi:amidohydrolase family protein [Novosphingobium bradum]|uniref:Amidohydrolase family protein n=1 Tax=Novosphingobium bradum TaxID=1737444 RepID=A0ABV7ILC6_9SPHN
MKMDDLILVSVDDHFVEPPEMYKNHLSGAMLESAPRFTSTNGVDAWVYGERTLPNIAMNAVAGRPPEEYGFEPTSLQGMRKGCWDVHERINDMDANGILGSVNYPSHAGLDGSLFLGHPDKKQALAHLQAYNDWHVDELCGAYPGRLIPLGLLPVWDVEETAKEIHRLAKKGCHAITFSDNPARKGLPSIHNAHWEPMWKAIADTDMFINLHIGSGNAPVHPSDESPIEVWTTVFPMAIAISASDWLHLEATRKYNMRISLTEGGIGWVPYLLERSDFTHWRHKAWTNSNFGDKKPSEVFREHFYGCFVDDQHGLANIDAIGVDNVFYECDYPHSDSVWPESPEILWPSISKMPEDVINKITHLNAIKQFRFDPFHYMPREECTVGALRAKAKANGVSTDPIRVGGAAKPIEDGEKRVVTSGDVTKLFTRAA